MMSKFFCPVVSLFFAATLSAQSTPPTSNPSSQSQPARRAAQENCMQQAGIEKSVMEQMRTIGHDARSRVESICSNSSLTPQQKQQQAREVREQAMQKRDNLMTPDQRNALRECQQQKAGNRPGEGGGMHEGAGGGCGEMPRGASRRNGPPSGTGSGSGNGNPPSSNSSPSQN